MSKKSKVLTIILSVILVIIVIITILYFNLVADTIGNKFDNVQPKIDFQTENVVEMVKNKEINLTNEQMNNCLKYILENKVKNNPEKKLLIQDVFLETTSKKNNVEFFVEANSYGKNVTITGNCDISLDESNCINVTINSMYVGKIPMSPKFVLSMAKNKIDNNKILIAENTIIFSKSILPFTVEEVSSEDNNFKIKYSIQNDDVYNIIDKIFGSSDQAKAFADTIVNAKPNIDGVIQNKEQIFDTIKQEIIAKIEQLKNDGSEISLSKINDIINEYVAKYPELEGKIREYCDVIINTLFTAKDKINDILGSLKG